MSNFKVALDMLLEAHLDKIKDAADHSGHKLFVEMTELHLEAIYTCIFSLYAYAVPLSKEGKELETISSLKRVVLCCVEDATAHTLETLSQPTP